MEYEAAVKAPLRLKGTANKDIKKKKKKSSKEKINREVDSKPNEAGKSDTQQQSQKHTIVKTKAQLKFEQMKEEQLKKRILEKASKTHKQRVEEFNRQLDSLTEHFDIPKVSWTK
nr:EOG090X0P1V [Ilyocryptus agilis]